MFMLNFMAITYFVTFCVACAAWPIPMFFLSIAVVLWKVWIPQTRREYKEWQAKKQAALDNVKVTISDLQFDRRASEEKANWSKDWSDV